MTRAKSPQLASARRGPVRPAATLLALLLVPVLARASEGEIQLVPEFPIRWLAEALGAPYGFRLVWLLLLFALLVAPVNQLVFKPLFRVLDAREEKINGTRARAGRLEADAEKVLQRCETSLRETREQAERERRSLLEEVRAEAQRAIVDARGETETRITQARSDIAVGLEQARATLRAEARELARQAASQVLGRAL